MTEFRPSTRNWFQKFQFAFLGIAKAIKGQSSFAVHFLCTILVVCVAGFLRVSLAEWAILLICIAVVLSAETFNSALERMAKAITSEHHEDIGDALDMASGAVLVAAMGAAIVGALVLGNRLQLLLFLSDPANGV